METMLMNLDFQILVGPLQVSLPVLLKGLTVTEDIIFFLLDIKYLIKTENRQTAAVVFSGSLNHTVLVSEFKGKLKSLQYSFRLKLLLEFPEEQLKTQVCLLTTLRLWDSFCLYSTE